MGKGNQVNGGVIGQQGDIGAGRQCRQHLSTMRAGFVAHMDNPAAAVRAFQSIHQFTLLVLIKLYPAAFHQHRTHQVRAFLGQNTGSMGRTQACPGIQNVVDKQVG